MIFFLSGSSENVSIIFSTYIFSELLSEIMGNDRIFLNLDRKSMSSDIVCKYTVNSMVQCKIKSMLHIALLPS